VSVLLLADAKAYLNIAGATQDAELQTFIDAAEAVIGRHVGPLAAMAVTERVYANGALVLSTVPAISLTSVTPVGGTALSLADLYLSPAAGVVSYNSGAPIGWGAYTVAYSAGRSTVPADLLLAVKELVRHLWESQRGTGTRAAGPFDSSSTGPAFMLPNRVAELLAPHMQPGFA
jgi:hypothetical protein